ncbi:hypothetical protein CRV00_05660 [Malaciobacter molluscorum]|uniref:restriction endonuclease PLD domain-containing protein n=1 Tax=Malaciobacter molluscorum TaxID=1032072 RepID=UPI00100B47ED|nr:restriction endonuclease PLD domain-containing protein [Malaciobacter molluscorum]RXJ94818.1 hypothetical protein CRV00_05660 [Malaciobacter molluscorum]
MELVSDNKKLKSIIVESIKKYKKIYIAVAWATYNEKELISRELHNNKNNIEKLIVGVEREITNPDFLIKFKEIIKIQEGNDGLFHPKIYLFSNVEETRWSLLIGSANLTYNAFHINTESMVLLTEKDSPDKFFKEIKDQINRYEKNTISIDDNYIKNYQILYEKRKNINNKKTFYDDYSNVSLYKLSWNDYKKLIIHRNTDSKSWYKERIKLLKKANEYFTKGLENISIEDFKALLGLKNYHEEILWYNFGHMRISIKMDYENFKLIVAEAIQHINIDGKVSKEAYTKYVNKLRQINGVSLSIISRFLALKRPDLFFCVTGENTHRFEKDFKYNYKRKNFDEYWDLVNKKFSECEWYTDLNAKEENSELWKVRAAMLDTILYHNDTV